MTHSYYCDLASSVNSRNQGYVLFIGVPSKTKLINREKDLNAKNLF